MNARDTATLASLAQRLEEVAGEVRKLVASSKEALAHVAPREQGQTTCVVQSNRVAPAPNSASPSLLVNQRELALLLSSSPRSIQRMRHEGLLPPPVKLAGRPRWRRADIERWLAEQCAP